MSIFLAIELSSIILFTIYLIHAYRRDALLGRLLNTKFLFLALLYAFIFEDVSITLFAGQSGGYFYNENFFFFIHNTPLFICLFWASILYSSYQIIQKIANKKQASFLIPLYALSLDIIMDIVAVKLNLWTWIGFESYSGFLSVPASNYLAWLLLPFAFIFTWEKLKIVKTPYQGVSAFLQPIAAFLLFLILTLPLFALKTLLFDTNILGQFLLVASVVTLFAILSIYFQNNFQNKKTDLSLFIIRLFIHTFSLLGIIWLDLYRDILILAIFCLVLFFEYIIIRRDVALLRLYKNTGCRHW